MSPLSTSASIDSAALAYSDTPPSTMPLTIESRAEPYGLGSAGGEVAAVMPRTP